MKKDDKKSSKVGAGSMENIPAADQIEALSQEQQQQLLEKYDTESNLRRLAGVMKWVIYIGLLSFSLFQLYTAIFGQFTAYIQRSIHLGFALTFIFYYSRPLKRKKR